MRSTGFYDVRIAHHFNSNITFIAFDDKVNKTDYN